ncbi:AAA family ATPase [Halobacteriaceae archaeon SHR40]|uniref:AAA family ATPase n=1 Tax=Halovenus amylolytica TaxID=2500550 RepID=UPI000FE30565
MSEADETTAGRGDIWLEKYRPQRFDEIVGQDAIVDRLRSYVDRNDLPNMLFAGPAGVGKTTSAIAAARELYGEDWEEHFLELNASDERGIDVVRDRIKSFARTSFGGANYRIIFLDEADALCVPPGTEVVAGYPSSPEVKPIEEVATDGEPIPSVDFETNEIQSDKGKLVDSGVADFFEVELADGRTILASLSHPFFVVDEDGTLVEKELRELSPGDKIADFKDDIGVSQCEVCGAWTAGRFCSMDCKDEGEEFEPALVSDGGLQTVETAEVNSIEYSHRGKAYNISMEGTPNFMLANGILTHNTSDAQSALRRTMEQFSNNVRFILSCNYSSQIIDPIQSRCTVFRFSPLPDEAIERQVRMVAENEGIEITDDGIEALIYVAGGDMRAAINGLQAAAVTGGVVDEESVFEITSTARPEDIEEMVTLALDGDFTASRTQLDRLLTDEGIAGGDIIDQLHRSVWEFELEDQAAVRVLDRIGEADYRITSGANERIQLEALLASLALEK